MSAKFLEVGSHELDLTPEILKPASRLGQHRGRRVQRDHVPVRQAPRQQLCDPASATPGVEDGLIAVAGESVEYLLAPPKLWVGDLSYVAASNSTGPIARGFLLRLWGGPRERIPTGTR